jgi:hypothetical protein
MELLAAAMSHAQGGDNDAAEEATTPTLNMWPPEMEGIELTKVAAGPTTKGWTVYADGHLSGSGAQLVYTDAHGVDTVVHTMAHTYDAAQTYDQYDAAHTYGTEVSDTSTVMGDWIGV